MLCLAFTGYHPFSDKKDIVEAIINDKPSFQSDKIVFRSKTYDKDTKKMLCSQLKGPTNYFCNLSSKKYIRYEFSPESKNFA